MTPPKILAILSIVLFSLIGLAAIFKDRSPDDQNLSNVQSIPLEIDLDEEIQLITPALIVEAESVLESVKEPEKETKPRSSIDLPETSRIEELFNKTGAKLPIVETITYKSRVSWQKGRPAWLTDYASHYGTSRHFIARSLNGKADYLKQELAEGDRFNVLRQDKKFHFHLLVDTSRCKMWFYYVDEDNKQKTLLKTYVVGLGRIDSSKTSGLLTPLGQYRLGDKIAVYKPKATGLYQGQKTEMIRVFGTRWIPFEKEVVGCTEAAKGFGVHGTPWITGSDGQLVENRESVGRYESDGCIRLSTDDMEELFAIIITRPTTIEIVRDFHESSLADLD